MTITPLGVSIASKDLRPEESAAIQENLALLALKQPRAAMRSNFYNGKERLHTVGFSIPPLMRDLDAVLGWPAKTCNVLSSRVKFGGFVLPGQASTDSELDAIWAANQMAIKWPQTQVSTFMHGCSFVAVTPGRADRGEPPILVSSMPATEATGVWDVRRQGLTSALWIPQQDPMYPSSFVLFLESHTLQGSRGQSGPWVLDRIPNPLPRVPVTMINHRPQLDRPYGMSRITRPVIYLTQSAVRTLLRTEVSAEFYNAPQRYAMGAKEEDFQDAAGNPISPWQTILGKVWMIGRDEETGDIPTVGQFPQATMQPNVDHMRMITTLFAGETALPVSTLGIIHDNPASAEAIDAAWADLVGEAELCWPEFGARLGEVGQNILMLAHGLTKLPDSLRGLGAKWRNAATPTLWAQTQATLAQIEKGVLRPDSEVALEQMGYDTVDISRIRAEHAAARNTGPIADLNSLLNQQSDAAGNSAVPAQ